MDNGGSYPNSAVFPAFDRPDNPVIAGFNTDIELNGVVYHVQTEDKGAPANMIMTLVYDKGTILASKRSKYDDLATGQIDETQLSERLSRQHKLMCAAVKGGRINELVEMTRKSSAANAKAKSASVPPAETVPKSPVAIPPVPQPAAIPVPVAEVPEAAPPRPPLSISIVDSSPVMPVDEMFFEDFPLIDAEIIEDIEILPDEAVEVVSELSGQDRPSNQKLSLELLGDSRFRGGERKTVNLMLCRGTDRKVVAEAQVMIKVLGSAFRPVIFHAKTDANGLARVHLQLPHFQAGRAALLVRAVTGGEEIELRRVVTPG